MSYVGLLINTGALVAVSIDEWNRKTEAITPGVQCRVMWGNKLVRDFKGEEVLSVGKVFFRHDVVIDFNYLFRYQGTDYSVVKILKPQDSVVHHHTEAYIM